MRHLLTPTSTSKAKDAGYIIRNQDYKQMVWDLTENMEAVRATTNPDAQRQGQINFGSNALANEAVRDINGLNNENIK